MNEHTHAWVIWPETDGQEQKCLGCGDYRKTPEEDKFWLKPAPQKPSGPEIVFNDKYTGDYCTIVNIVYINKAGSRSLRRYRVWNTRVEVQNPICRGRNITYKLCDKETSAWVLEVMKTAKENNLER